MLKLHAKMNRTWDADPFVVRIATSPDRPAEVREREALVVGAGEAPPDSGFRIYLTREPGNAEGRPTVVSIPDPMRYLDAGDVVRIVPRTGGLVTLYRKASPSN